MKKIILLLLFTLLFTFSATNSFAQVDRDSDEFQDQNTPPNRGQLLRELGLTKEQIQQIRVLNEQRKPLIQQAQRRLREANQSLDQAIYADGIDEAAFQIKLKEVQAAHAEVQKIRANSEFEIRKILTPAQLVKFRELRNRFLERARENQQRRQNRRQNMGKSPFENKNQNPRNGAQKP